LFKRISIVTISYNQAAYLNQAIDSVLKQNYDNLEYIIVDPGSTDGSRDIINEYKDRISKIIYTPDSGPAEGLNNGFAEATGDIYGYLNSDDILFPDVLKKVNQIFQKRSTTDVLSGHGYEIDENAVIQKKLFSKKMNIKQYLYGNCTILQPSTFFKAGLFKKVGGFNSSNKIAWDGELMLDFARINATFTVTQNYWSGFRLYSNSISGNEEYLKTLKDDYSRLLKKFKYQEPNNTVKKINWFYSWLINPKTLFNRLFTNANFH